VIFESAIGRLGGAIGLTLALLAPYAAIAQVAVPPLSGHVTDQTGTLTPAQQSALEQTLSAFEARKGSQLAVLIVPTTAPEAIEQFALRVAEQWKLGRKKMDDGAILVVAKNDRSMRIEVGYGLEGALTDITSKRIISETITPMFKQEDYFGGVEAGVSQIIRVVDGEPLPEPVNRPTAGIQDIRQFAPFLFIVALAVGGVLRSVFGKVAGSVLTGVGVSLLAWFVIGTLFLSVLAGFAAVLVTLLGGTRMLYGMGGMGGGGRGGFGGGGFRGGGGGFGGGGASGRW
jgi:uncharacterized protein